jgi:hypothetical protein
VDIIYALALTLLVNGAEVNYPISYSNTLQECQQKSHRIIFTIKQIEPEATNVVRAKCIKITVLSEPNTNA